MYLLLLGPAHMQVCALGAVFAPEVAVVWLCMHADEYCAICDSVYLGCTVGNWNLSIHLMHNFDYRYKQKRIDKNQYIDDRTTRKIARSSHINICSPLKAYNVIADDDIIVKCYRQDDVMTLGLKTKCRKVATINFYTPSSVHYLTPIISSWLRTIPEVELLVIT